MNWRARARASGSLRFASHHADPLAVPLHELESLDARLLEVAGQSTLELVDELDLELRVVALVHPARVVLKGRVGGDGLFGSGVAEQHVGKLLVDRALPGPLADPREVVAGNDVSGLVEVVAEVGEGEGNKAPCIGGERALAS